MDFQKSVFLEIAKHTVREWDRCVDNDLARYTELMECIWGIISEALKVITGKSYTMGRDDCGYGILSDGDHLDVLWSEARNVMPFDEESGKIHGKKGSEIRWGDKNPDTNRNVNLPLRVSRTEKEEIQEKAREHGISVVELVVRAVRNYI
jgi:hypothetical protein